MNNKTRIALLAGVMTMASMMENQAEARRLVPDRPSVEVRLEALRALRSSVEYEQQMRMQQAFQPPAPPPVYEEPVAPVPAQSYQRKPSIVAERPVAPVVPQQQYIPAPVQPKPQPPIVQAQKPPAVAPAPKPAQPTRYPELTPATPPIIAVAPTPAKTEPELAKPAKPQELEPKQAEAPAFTPVPTEKPKAPEQQMKMAEQKPVPVPVPAPASAPIAEPEPLPLTEETNAAPTDDVESLLDLSLEDIVNEDTDTTAENNDMANLPEQVQDDQAIEEAPLTLEETPETSEELPDVQESVDESLPILEETESLETLEALPETDDTEIFQKDTDTEDEAKELAETAESLPEPELEGFNFEELPESEEPALTVHEDADEAAKPEEEATAELQELEELPEIPEVTEQDIAMPDAAQIPESQMPEDAAPAEAIEAPDNAETAEVAEEEMPEAAPALSEDEMQQADVAPEKPALTQKQEKEGFFPNISRAFSNLFGDDKEEQKPAIAPKAEADIAEESPTLAAPEYTEPQVMDLDEESLEITTEVEEDIPEEEQVTNVPDAPVADIDTMPREEGLPELPDFAVSSPATKEPLDNGLPPLPNFGGQEAIPLAEDEQLESLPPLPFGEQQQTTEEAPKEEQQTAMLESVEDMDLPSIDNLELAGDPEDVKLSVLFSKSETEVPLSFQQPLIALSKELIANPEQSVKVIAYASGTDDQKSIAKRISLARALAVRAFLIDLGVDNVRISVQALGNDGVGNGSSERADIILSNG